MTDTVTAPAPQRLPTDRWLAAVPGLPPLDGPAGTGERLLLLLHYGVDWDAGCEGPVDSADGILRVVRVGRRCVTGQEVVQGGGRRGGGVGWCWLVGPGPIGLQVLQGGRSFSPVWDWTADDIYSHLARRHVPVNPVYAKLREIGGPCTKK